MKDLPSVPAAVADLDLLGVLLDHVRHAAHETWPELLAGLMPALPRQVCAKAAHQLAAAGETRRPGAGLHGHTEPA